MEMHKDKKPPVWAKKMSDLNTYMSQNFLGGPKVLKLAWVINFQKTGTFFFVTLLMVFYENYSTAAFIYLALHGSYGFCWILKHFVFPDKRWEEKITFGGAAMAFLMVLGPYWVFPFLLISGVLGPDHSEPSNFMLMFCVSVHTLGVVIMMASDCQKYYTLKYHSGLIEEGMYKHIRHPNYLGEMMLYGSYALLVNHWIPWIILAWVWSGLFLVNIVMKEASMSRYPGWEAYKTRTGMLLPWKLLKSELKNTNKKA